MKVFLAGEGVHELGSWGEQPAYREQNRRTGVIEALLLRIRAEGWEVDDALLWRSIVKFEAGKHRRPETRNVLGAALRAKERGCELLVFVRDRDGDHDRQKDLEEGLRLARERFPMLTIVGGFAIEALESWILALLGKHRTEDRTGPKEALAKEAQVDTLEQMVNVVNAADLARLPDDAKSLRNWIDAASAALCANH